MSLIAKLCSKFVFNIMQAAAILLVCCFLTPAIVIGASGDTEQGNELAPLESWDRVSADAKNNMMPIVLLVEQRHCRFCLRAKSERLRPASLSSRFAGKAIFVSLATDLDEPPITKDGSTVSTFDFAQDYGASFTPTVLFLDYLGSELQERMIGYSTDQSELAVFEQRLSAAINAVTR